MTTLRAISYYVTPEITIHNRDPELRFPDKSSWAIVNSRFGDCLNTDGEWEYEPMPSSRDDEFLTRCRHTLEEATRLAYKKISEEPNRFAGA